MNMNRITTQLLVVMSVLLFIPSLSAQKVAVSTIDNSKIDFEDRRAVLTALENFYIGDKIGCVKHKKLSMAEKGAYRYINRDGEYAEYQFDLGTAQADTTFTEELQTVEIFDKIAVAKLRHIHEGVETPSYKVMLLHKIKGKWRITSIAWGNGIVQ